MCTSSLIRRPRTGRAARRTLRRAAGEPRHSGSRRNSTAPGARGVSAAAHLRLTSRQPIGIPGDRSSPGCACPRPIHSWPNSNARPGSPGVRVCFTTSRRGHRVGQATCQPLPSHHFDPAQQALQTVARDRWVVRCGFTRLVNVSRET